MGNPFTVSMVSWHDGEPLLRGVREAVFMREQNVPAELEWDGLDENCRHALVLSMQGDAIGCGRILADGHIGRIAVLPEWRGRKVGSAVMEALIEDARMRQLVRVEVDAQTHAVPFYLGLGFAEQGETFMDAGLAHVKMTMSMQGIYLKSI